MNNNDYINLSLNSSNFDNLNLNFKDNILYNNFENNNNKLVYSNLYKSWGNIIKNNYYITLITNTFDNIIGYNTDKYYLISIFNPVKVQRLV